jgi:hypothetical protein
MIAVCYIRMPRCVASDIEISAGAPFCCATQPLIKWRPAPLRSLTHSLKPPILSNSFVSMSVPEAAVGGRREGV